MFNATFNNMLVISWWLIINLLKKRIRVDDTVKEIDDEEKEIPASFCQKGRRGHDGMVVGFTPTCAISHITTKVVSSKPLKL